MPSLTVKGDISQPGQVTVRVHAHLAWWVKHYVFGVTLMSALSGKQADSDKVKAVLKRGIRTTVEVVRHG